MTFVMSCGAERLMNAFAFLSKMEVALKVLHVAVYLIELTLSSIPSLYLYK